MRGLVLVTRSRTSMTFVVYVATVTCVTQRWWWGSDPLTSSARYGTFALCTRGLVGSLPVSCMRYEVIDKKKK